MKATLRTGIHRPQMLRRALARLAPPRPARVRALAGEPKSRTLLDTLRERGAARTKAADAAAPEHFRATSTQILQNMLKRGERGTAEKVLRRAMLQARRAAGALSGPPPPLARARART